LTVHTKNSDHIKELNNTKPKQPFFFLKPTTSILPPRSGPVLRPRGVNLHYEVELGLIIGKTIRDFDARDEKGAIDAIDSKHTDSLTKQTISFQRNLDSP
jgi:acylpyruvate hydrolase